MPLCRYEGVIEYEAPETWPTELTACFRREFHVLRAYEHRRNEIENACHDNILALFNLPSNDYSQRDFKLSEKRWILLQSASSWDSIAHELLTMS